nr:MAG TPA: hypothetical protein [Caudoviricetes sp.]
MEHGYINNEYFDHLYCGICYMQIHIAIKCR